MNRKTISKPYINEDKTGETPKVTQPLKEPISYMLLRMMLTGLAAGAGGAVVYFFVLAIQAVVVGSLGKAWMFGLLGMALGTAPLSLPLLIGLAATVVGGFICGAIAMYLFETCIKEKSYKSATYLFEGKGVNKSLVDFNTICKKLN